MSKQTYDWRAAETAISIAIGELMTAQRHRNHRKRVNVLNDLLAAQQEITKAWNALVAEREERV